jgi:SAM-dependent methyltransferase
VTEGLSLHDALVAFHATYAGSASAVFDGGTLPDGLSSYEWLAGMVDPARHARVVDLGCGDGFLLAMLREQHGDRARLVGVDMSRAELDVAARRFEGADVRLVEADAARTGIPTASQDAVVSHMALMLMPDSAAVLSEAARILRPGGLFAAVIGRRGAERSGAAREFYGKLRTVIAAEPRSIQWGGDGRLQSEDGIQDLFAAWNDLDVQDSVLTVRVPVAGLWPFLEIAYYDVALLSPDGKAAMRAYVEGDLAAYCGEGDTSWTFPIRLLSATR